MKQTTEQREQARAKLREWLPPGNTVWTILRHVSSSGMTRDISPIIVVDGKPVDISYWVIQLGIGSQGRNGGVRLGGAGMDMGFHLVYSLSRELYSDGYECLEAFPHSETGEIIHHKSIRCPANDHFNRVNLEELVTTDGEGKQVILHHDGGYAISHEWL